MIPHDLEERVEDAIVSYLRRAIPGSIRAYAARDYLRPQYPMVTAHGYSNEGVAGDDAGWHGPRNIKVSIRIMVEDAPEKDGDTVVRTPRELDRWVRAAVIGALSVPNLRDLVMESAIPGVHFSACQLEGGERGVDEEARVQMTERQVFVTAEAVEL